MENLIQENHVYNVHALRAAYTKIKPHAVIIVVCVRLQSV